MPTQQMTLDGFGNGKGVTVDGLPKPKHITEGLPDLDSFDYVGVAVSGGIDSQVCADLAFKRFGKDKVYLVHAMVEPPETPTDQFLWETKENIQHLEYLENLWQKKIDRVTVINPVRAGYKPSEVVAMPDEKFQVAAPKFSGLTTIVLNASYMPGASMPYCTKGKVLAMERWSRQFGSSFLWVHGQRAEEGAGRALLPEYGFELENKRYIWRPVHKWTRKQEIEYLEQLGQKVNPIYALGFGHAGNCSFCHNENKPGLRKAVKQDRAKAIRFIEQIEKVVGPRRDYSVEQALRDSDLEQKLPGVFDEQDEIENSLPHRSCGVSDGGWGCDD